MEWLMDPTAWVGLLTLVVLEIVLGIDNLVFIAILVDKLPPAQRDRARVLGLSLALLMRLGLLTVMSHLVQLTDPLISIFSLDFSGRDLIMIVGGFFLLFKGTLELHERIENRSAHTSGSRMYASFWVIVAQIVVLDAVFSIDAVITAVGMVEHLPIMMAAVVIAIGIMLVASKPLTAYINSRPTVVILCLGFLLMIGFSLLVEGFGVHVPKGYLYAAISFSILIEMFNQLARRKLRMLQAGRPMRERTAEAVLRMLGKRPASGEAAIGPDLPGASAQMVFGQEERNMVSGVLTLSERTVHSVMTPRNAITWVNIQDSAEVLREKMTQEPHSMVPVCRGSLDEVIGIGRSKELLADLLIHGHIRVDQLRQPVFVYESIGILDLMETIKQSRGQLVMVTDEFGTIEGLVTPLDIFEAIAGDFPSEDEAPDIVQESQDHWLLDGSTDLHHLEQMLGVDGLVDEDEEYATLAGYLLTRFGQLPKVGDVCVLEQSDAVYRFKVEELEGRRISQVSLERAPYDDEQIDPFLAS
ncbi:membrane protein [Alcaligenes faecalis]|uniref:TerC family protein n=1 Tax=Alcaligenes faecalis TaxID=511 RepID=UPI0007C50028|nr:TerC family protein [Alcaligenes faecalis]ARP52857.1 membrane protein [Alcaligenes faecalis]